MDSEYQSFTIYLFIWLRWVFVAVRRLLFRVASLLPRERGSLSSWRTGVAVWGLLDVWASVVGMHRLIYLHVQSSQTKE